MATHVTFTRNGDPTGENFGSNFASSIFLHLLIAAVIFGAALLSHKRGASWGENASTAGAIQATMVASIPLPPKQRELDTGVLTSESPSPAPIVAKERTEPPPAPNDQAGRKANTRPTKTPATRT
jgi:protein TonB